jgi:NADPH-dependent 2,4-dienoyl-CoA reductase/sulfur reductase-like enzyme
MSESFDPTAEALAHGIVVVGAGQAGGRAIEALRQGGFAGSITLVGDEPHLPYERPPISKEMLAPGGEQAVAWVRPAEWYDEVDVTRRLGVRATRIDRESRALVLDDGSVLPYGVLVLATGARPRALPVPGADHPACLFVRTLEDSAMLRPVLRPGAHIVVIGAGFIGLEVAAAARNAGADVSVLEVGQLVMARGVPIEISEHYAAMHTAHGVTLHFGASTDRIEDLNGRAVVHTADAQALAADAVVIGIGVVPNTELAEAAGLDVANGIQVDAQGRTSDPAIYAAGDVTSHPNALYGQMLRLESWQNAQNQAIAVARNILGADKDYAEVPWFWSDQFGHNLQIAGLPGPGDEIVGRGILGEGAALRFHFREGRLVAAIGLDAARDLRFAKELIALGGDVPASVMADPTTKLADLLKAARARRVAA